MADDAVRLWLRLNALLLGVRDPESVSDALLAELIAACGARIPPSSVSAGANDGAGGRDDGLPPRLADISAALAARGVAWPVDYCEDSDADPDRAGEDQAGSLARDARDPQRPH